MLRYLPLAALLISCSGGGGSASNGNTNATPAGGGMDGSWDITTAGDDEIGVSSMTITGNVGLVEGRIADKREGKTDSLGCLVTKSGTEFRLAFEGNALSGSFTEVREYSGSGASCSSRTPKITNITGTRAVAASGSTSIEGEWEVRVGDDDPFVVNITGLTAKAWDKKAKAEGKEAAVDVTVAGGTATATAKKDDFQFAARRR